MRSFHSTGGFNLLLFLLLITPFFFSCIPKQSSSEGGALQKVYNLGGKTVRLAIEMPENKLVFENISPLVYEALWNHFERVGFTMVSKAKDCYSLKVTVENVDSSYKFLSPDLLTYATKIKIDLLCQLFDKNDHLCIQKNFSFGTLVSKAKEYVANSSFTDFEYRQLLEREAYKIDQFLRPFFIDKKT